MHRKRDLVFILGDFICLLMGMIFTVFSKNCVLQLDKFFYHHIVLILSVSPIWLTIYFIEGLTSLRSFNRNGLAISLVRGVFFSSIVSVIFLYLFPEFFHITPKTNLILFSLFVFVLCYGWRKLFFKIFSYKLFMKEVIYIGKSSEVKELQKVFEEKKYLGFHLKNIFEEYEKVSLDIRADLIIIEDKLLNKIDISQKVFQILNSGYNVITLSEFSEMILGKVPLMSIDGHWFLDKKISLYQQSYNVIKSIFDRIIVVLALILFIPLLICVVPFMLLVEGRPIFYSQRRVGLNNKEFIIYKLRTMNINAEVDGAQWSQKNDRRITRMGKFLRSTRIDETPQLWNVLNGSMSLVGPRPERPEIIKDKLIDVIPFYDYRHLVKPGITGWAQVNYGYGSSKQDSLEKLRYDLFYIKNKTLWFDLRIVLKTIRIILKKFGR